MTTLVQILATEQAVQVMEKEVLSVEARLACVESLLFSSIGFPFLTTEQSQIQNEMVGVLAEN